MTEMTDAEMFEAMNQHTRDRLAFAREGDLENASISDSYFWQYYHLLKVKRPKWAYSARQMRQHFLSAAYKKRRGELNWEQYQRNHRSTWLETAIFCYITNDLEKWIECIRVGEVV
jgi:hypothetical protein